MVAETRHPDTADLNDVASSRCGSSISPWSAPSSGAASRSRGRRTPTGARSIEQDGALLRRPPPGAGRRAPAAERPAPAAGSAENGLFGRLTRLLRGPIEPPPTPALEAELRSIVGYAGLWLMTDEAHITTIAVDPDFQGNGVGELLLVALIDRAQQIGARWLTLEVRVSNDVAQSLYGSTRSKRWACGDATTATTARTPSSCGPTRSTRTTFQEHPGTQPRGTRLEGWDRMTDTLVLIDGHALVFRAFYGVPTLTTPERRARQRRPRLHVDAVQGLARSEADATSSPPSTTRRRRSAWRSSRSTRRQAGRPPEGLREQFPCIFKLLDCMNIPVYSLEGYEADDLLGHALAQAEQQGLDVVILTGDRRPAAGQPTVPVLTSRRGFSDTVLYDVDAVQRAIRLRPPADP